MPPAESERDDGPLEDGSKHRPVVSLGDPGDRDGKLPVVELLEADVDGILDAPTEEEEGSRVLCEIRGQAQLVRIGIVTVGMRSD